MVGLLLTVVAVLGRVEDPPKAEAWWDARVESSLDRAPARRAVWVRALEATPPDQRPGMAYLVTDLPEGDLDKLDPSALSTNVAIAYQARKAVPWGSALPEDVFLDGVLPHRTLTEPFDPMRSVYLAKYLPLVKECKTPGEAGLKVNAALFRDYKVTYNTRRLRTDQCSRESIAQGMATCTGLSIMLVEACRAVGVPARVAGIHSWPGRGGNHTWVEIWDAGRWHYVGAAEPDPNGLDHAWFGGDAATAIKDKPENAVFATSYRKTSDHFRMVWNRSARVNAENVTDRYTAKAKGPQPPRLMVEVLKGGERVVADVSAYDRSTGLAALVGKSLGPAADINLHLSGPVKPGDSFLVVARRDGQASCARATVQDDTVVRIDLDRTSPEDRAADLSAILKDRFGEDPAKRDIARKLLAEVPYDPATLALAWDAYKASPLHADMRKEFDAKTVKTKDRESPYLWRHVGEKPKDGWALVIAMHGGGNAPKRVNDSQWTGMFERYYKEHPEAGGYVYLALRAPNDSWNGFYDDAICPMVDRLIEQFVLFGEVNPDRVYTLGASHGGYGAFVIGTKTPDRFAAVHASASAPTEGETQGVNLLNTRFTFMVGEKDTAYGRAERCQAFAKQVEAWRAERGGYPGEFEWRPGVGHSVPDRDKVGEMLAFTREPRPKSLVWVQTDDVLKHFFWVEAPNPVDGGRVEVSIHENTIKLKAEKQDKLALWLDSKLVDLARPLTIEVDGGKTQTVTPRPSVETYCLGLEERGDPKLSAGVRVEIDLK